MSEAQNLADHNRALVGLIYDKVLSGELDALAPWLDEDFHIVEADGLPYAGVYRGLEGMKMLLATIAALWGDTQGEIESLIADGDQVAAVLTLSGTDRRGKPASIRICEIWRIQDGKARSVHPFYWDTHAVRHYFT